MRLNRASEKSSSKPSISRPPFRTARPVCRDSSRRVEPFDRSWSWEQHMTELQGVTALVTGGAGTIGSTIVDQLLAADVARIRILDNLVRGRRANLAEALADPRVDLVVGDLRDIDLVHDLTRGSDLVFHEAAIRITQC